MAVSEAFHLFCMQSGCLDCWGCLGHCIASGKAGERLAGLVVDIPFEFYVCFSPSSWI